LIDERLIGLRHDSLSDHGFSFMSFYLAKLDLRFSSNEIAYFSNRPQSSRPLTAPEDIPHDRARPLHRDTVTTSCPMPPFERAT
jgi:hypothetical protein